MRIKFWSRRPTGVPRRASVLSTAYQAARLDLDTATAMEDRWYALLCDRRASVLLDDAESVNHVTEKIFEARTAQIDALWRLGWDKTAREKQADLDMRLGWHRERKELHS